MSEEIKITLYSTEMTGRVTTAEMSGVSGIILKSDLPDNEEFDGETDIIYLSGDDLDRLYEWYHQEGKIAAAQHKRKKPKRTE